MRSRPRWIFCGNAAVRNGGARRPLRTPIKEGRNLQRNSGLLLLQQKIPRAVPVHPLTRPRKQTAQKASPKRKAEEKTRPSAKSPRAPQKSPQMPTPRLPPGLPEPLQARRAPFRLRALPEPFRRPRTQPFPPSPSMRKLTVRQASPKRKAEEKTSPPAKPPPDSQKTSRASLPERTRKSLHQA